MNPDDAAHILNRDKRMGWTTRLEKGRRVKRCRVGVVLKQATYVTR